MLILSTHIDLSIAVSFGDHRRESPNPSGRNARGIRGFWCCFNTRFVMKYYSSLSTMVSVPMLSDTIE